MRILHLLSQIELTGAEIYAQRLIIHQFQNKHDIWVISDKLHIEIPSVCFLSKNIATRSFWKRMNNILWLVRFLRKNQIDVIHCHSRGASRHAFWACLFTKTAQITSLHGRQHFSWSKRFFDIYGQYMIAICRNVAESMFHQFSTKRSKIKLIPNPIEIKQYPFNSISSQSNLLGIIGRSSGPKGQRIEFVLKNCLPSWLPTFSDLNVEIIVNQPELFSQEAQKQIHELSNTFSGRFQVRKHIKNLNEQYVRYRAVIGSGRVAMEALLSGTSCFALGEFEYCGLITPHNWKKATDSNFGDIGITSMEGLVDWNSLTQDFTKFWSQNTDNLEIRRNLRSFAEQEFSEQGICEEILEIYKNAIFKKNVFKGIPMIMYHKIPKDSLLTKHRIFVCKDSFEKHLCFFKKRGFTALTFSELQNFLDLKTKYALFPKKPFLITFDDGYKDNLTNAEPLLKKYGFKANIFLLANHEFKKNDWDLNENSNEPASELLSLEEKKRLDPFVWEIGSHGFQHLHLNQVSKEKAFEEMQKSKKQLEKDLSVKIVAFAYPFGNTNSDLALLAKKAGYRFAVNTDSGGLHLADNLFAIFRANIFPEDGFWQLWKKTSFWYRRYYFFKRGR